MRIICATTSIKSEFISSKSLYSRNSSCYYGLPCKLQTCEEDDCGLLKVRENQCRKDFDANDENLFKEQFVGCKCAYSNLSFCLDAFKNCYHILNQFKAYNFDYAFMNIESDENFGILFIMHLYHQPSSTSEDFIYSAEIEFCKYGAAGGCSYKWFVTIKFY